MNNIFQLRKKHLLLPLSSEENNKTLDLDHPQVEDNGKMCLLQLKYKITNLIHVNL